MKRIAVFIVLCFGCAFSFGCSHVSWVKSHTEFEKDVEGNVVASRYHRTTKGVDFFGGDKEEARTWESADHKARRNSPSGQATKEIALIQTSSSTSGSQVFLPIRNTTTEYRVKVLSPPFDGVELEPNSSDDEERPLNVGRYPLTYEWTNIKTGKRGTKTVNIEITSNREKPVTIGQ